MDKLIYILLVYYYYLYYYIFNSLLEEIYLDYCSPLRGLKDRSWLAFYEMKSGKKSLWCPCSKFDICRTGRRFIINTEEPHGDARSQLWRCQKPAMEMPEASYGDARSQLWRFIKERPTWRCQKPAVEIQIQFKHLTEISFSHCSCTVLISVLTFYYTNSRQVCTTHVTINHKMQ